MRRAFLCLTALLISGLALAQEAPRDTTSAAPEPSADPHLVLDTVRIHRQFEVNDYMTLGFEGGAALNNMLFNPPKDTRFFLGGSYVNILFTYYSKLFGYMPFFGVQIGFAHTTGGYRFKEDPDTKITPMLDGYTGGNWKVAEVPFLMVFRYDAPHFRIMAKAGMYAGYRYGIERQIGDRYKDMDGVIISGYNVHDYANAWRDIDRRYDYGLEGGAGFAFVFDPFEFHINGLLKYGWSSLYQPDYASPYYYRFSYPFDVFITAGIHVQLTRRTGKSKAQLRKEAYDAVYNPSLTELAPEL